MINKRLLASAKDDKKYIYLQVVTQVISLCMQIIIMSTLAYLINETFNNTLSDTTITISVVVFVVCIAVRFMMQRLGAKMSYLAARTIRENLRTQIFQKLLKVNQSYREELKTSELVQLAVEGVDQLEVYFGRYVPQFFYSLLAPIILFIYLVSIDWKAALVLLICVPIIPGSIMMVQKFAKKLLSKYWGLYTNLGDSFLDNIRGLTTLKVYGSDAERHKEMNEDAEKFRRVTMKVLIMQLNSISLMDFVAFGGAAIGIVIALHSFQQGNINIGQAFLMIMLSADFFIPMRLLGSFFHIAMNGNAASKKIFKFLDYEVEDTTSIDLKDTAISLTMEHVNYAYEENTYVLENISLETKTNGLYSFVGESGCGKSTLVNIMNGVLTNYEGTYDIQGVKAFDVHQESMFENVIRINDYSYLFQGSVRSNLLDGNDQASEEDMLDVLKQVNMYDYFMSQDGLDTAIKEKASNLSGGQQQRFALARALLKKAHVYIFDEATSNIDAESEANIMEIVEELSKKHLVILVSHRLQNVVSSTMIYAMKDGHIVEQGKHQDLLKLKGHYFEMFEAQAKVEAVVGVHHE